MIIKDVSPEWFAIHISELVIDALIHQDPRERAQHFTNIMDTARALDLGEQAEEVAQAIAKREGEPELWELPEPFEKPVELTSFPVSTLPKALSEYLKEVTRTVQVFPEMCALPLLSTLSLCVQGKACIQFPGNDHTEPLNIYTLTVASPGQRKTSCFSCFTTAVDNYVKRYNAIHSVEIQNNKAERAVIEKQINKEICSKNPNMDHIKELNEKLNSMDRLNELRMNIKDITPEALAWEMFLQNERIGILDDEGGVFDILGGLYSGGQSNLSIFLEAYDGSPYSIIRRTKENITLYSPLLTIGLMTQPDYFEKIMNNKQFSGRGLIQRFLFAFPGSRTGQQKLTTGTIDHDMNETENKNRRDLYLKIRVNREELEAIDRKFRNSGMKSRSEFIRAMIFEGYIVQFSEDKMNELLKLARSISNNVNQIAVRANSSGKVYADDIADIKRGVEELWQPLRYFQSLLMTLHH